MARAARPPPPAFEVLGISSGSSRIPKNSGGRGLGAALRNAPNSGEFGYAQLRSLQPHVQEAIDLVVRRQGTAVGRCFERRQLGQLLAGQLVPPVPILQVGHARIPPPSCVLTSEFRSLIGGEANPARIRQRHGNRGTEQREVTVQRSDADARFCQLRPVVPAAHDHLEAERVRLAVALDLAHTLGITAPQRTDVRSQARVQIVDFVMPRSGDAEKRRFSNQRVVQIQSRRIAAADQHPPFSGRHSHEAAGPEQKRIRAIRLDASRRVIVGNIDKAESGGFVSVHGRR